VNNLKKLAANCEKTEDLYAIALDRVRQLRLNDGLAAYASLRQALKTARIERDAAETALVAHTLAHATISGASCKAR
jgi:hypothetical protein